VEVLDDHYAPDVADTAWLAEVGKKSWVVLSQDQSITRNPLEQRTLLAANVAFFGLARGDAPGPEKAATIAAALPGVRRALQKCGLPLIATISKSGDVYVKWDAGKRLEKPRTFLAPKPRR
jgi:hypothetical protein